MEIKEIKEIRMNAVSAPCPFPGCDVFPYDDPADLVHHITEAHMVADTRRMADGIAAAPKPLGSDATATTSGRFQTEANGFGGTTTVRVAPTHPDLPALDSGATLADIHAFLATTFASRKLEITDVTPRMHTYAEAWLRTYTGNFQFLLEVAQDLATRGKLSAGQAKGVLNCIRADALRAAPKAVEAPAGPVSRINLRDLPESAYGNLYVAVPDHTTGQLVFLVIAQKRVGKVVVLQQVGGNDDLYLGCQPDGHIYTGKRTAELEAVLADPQAAIIAYGLHFTRCGVCGTQLTDDSPGGSIERGIGPKCAAKAGW